MNDFFFSIVIAAYNAEKYISQAIESILKQSFYDYEIIIVNDGSTDKTIDICRDLSHKNNCIKIIDSENMGAFLARRKALKAAKGKYILFLDSDDMFRSDALVILYKILSNQDLDMLIFNASRELNYNVPFREKDYKYNYVYEGNDYIEMRNDIITGYYLNNLCMKCIKKNVIDINDDCSSFRDVFSGEDGLQMLPILDVAKTAYFIDENLYYYRPNENSITHLYNPKRYKSIKKVLIEVWKYAEKWNVSDNVILGYHLRCLETITQCIKELIKADIGYEQKKSYINDISNDDFFLSEYEFLHLKRNNMDKIFCKLIKEKKYFFINVIGHCYKLIK